MKQKLPGKLFSYKNIDLGETRETPSNSLNLRTRHSLIGSLVTIFSKKKYFVDLFNVRIVTILLSWDSRCSKKSSNNRFILNIFVLFTLPILMYRSNGQTMVGQKNFDLTKILGRNQHEKNYTGVYKNYFQNFNTNFNIFLHNSFPRKKQIPKKLQSWDKPDEVIVRFSASLEKICYSFNYMELPSRKLFENYLYDSKESQQQFFSERILYSRLSDKLSNTELFIIPENFLSDSIYRISRCISYVAGESNSKRMNTTNLSNNKLCNSMDSINPDYTYIYGENEFSDLDRYACVEKDSKDISFIRFPLSSERKTDPSRKALVDKRRFVMNNSLSHRNGTKTKDFTKSISYVFLELLSREIFRPNVSYNKDFSKVLVEKNHYSKDYAGSDYTRVKNLWEIHKYYSSFSWDYSFPFNPAYTTIRKKNDPPVNRRIIYIFSKNKLFTEIIHSLLSILPKCKELRILTNCIGLEKFLARNKNGLDIPINESDGTKDPDFKKISPPLDRSNNSSSSKNNNSSNSSNNSSNKSINNYSSLEAKIIEYNPKFIEDPTRIISLNFHDSMQNGWDKCFNELLNKLHLKLVDSKDNYMRKSIINRYSMTWKKIVQKSYVYSIEDTSYNKVILKVYEWIDRTNSWITFSKNFVFRKSRMKIEPPTHFLEIWFQMDSRSIDKLLGFTRIFADIRGTRSERNTLFDRSERFINRNCMASFRFGNTHNSITKSLINKLPSKYISSRGFTLGSRSEKLLPFYFERVSSGFVNHLQNFKPNCNKRFILHSEKVSIKNCSLTHLQFLKILTKRNGFIPIINRIKYYFLRKRKNMVTVAQSRLSSVFPLKAPYKNLDRKGVLSFSDSFKESPNRINLYFSVISNMTRSERRANKTETLFHYQSLFERNNFFRGMYPKDSDILALQQNNTGAETHYNMLCFELLMRNKKRNNEILKSINRIFLYPKSKHHESRESKCRIGKKKLRNTNESYTYNQYTKLNFFAKYIPFNSYTSWFFTSEWWEYYIYTFIEKFRGVPLIINYHSKYLTNQVIQKNLQSFWKIGFYDSNSKWNSRIFIDYEEKKVSDFSWSDLELINNWSGLHWAILTLVVPILLFFRNYFPVLISLDCIDLWNSFEIVKYLTDTSRAFHLTKLMYRSEVRLSKAENAVTHSFRDLLHYTKNIRFYLLTNKKLKGWLISNKSLDLSRRKRNLLIQSLITHTKLKGYGFQLYPKQKLLSNEFGYRVTHQQGLLYLQYLSKISKKKLVNHSLHLADKWILSASLQRIILSRTLWQAKRFDPGFHEIPIPLQFGLSCSKGILLVGPIETGRSYLIKNLAAESCVPLLKVSINKLLYNKPDVITENWMNILIESLRRLNLTLDLARKMSPCTIWIQNIHQLDVNRSTQNVESDPTFLLGILLKHFQTGKTQIKNNVIVIGSTHVPKKVDPALISPNRLDRIINIRLFNNFQRKNQFYVLLNRSKFRLKKNLSYFDEFGSRTMGYNVRDLTAFTNEILLISITRNESLICTDTMRFAFHRQIFGSTHRNNESNFQQNFEVSLYKLGKAIIQNILVEGSAANPLSIRNFLHKKKFYYLSKWYLESSIDESTVKESAVLTHILGCLAGTAARDSWSLLGKNSDTSISLDKLIENDFNLASSILESLFVEFPQLETCETQSVGYQKKGIVMFSTGTSLSIMQNGILAMESKNTIQIQNDSQYKSSISQQKNFNGRNCESRNTAWSPRFWRLSFFRSQLFDWIKRPNDFKLSLNSMFPGGGEHIAHTKSSGGRNSYNQLLEEKEEQLLYERILPRVRRRNVQELESQFEEILLEEQSEILGFFRSSTEYQMEYQLNNKLRFFIGKRILWDPIGSFPHIRHSVFSRRNLFIDEEMLRRLYVTYGTRRERERPRSTHKVKEFFLCRGYNNDLINKLSVRWWNQLPMNGKRSINTLKRVEKIGIQLERPRIFTPVYLYQRWLIENLPEKFPRFELLTHQQRWLTVNNLSLNDSLVHTTLSESYRYLLKFFLSNRILLNKMMKILLKKGWLFQSEIRDLIHNTR